jgi:dTDP-4-amino-4,6-dideoxygalactose transaminase
LAQLEKKDEIIKKRKENAMYYIENLKDLEEHLQLPYIPPDRDHMFMLFPIVLRSQNKRELVNFLEDHSIETRDLMPLVNQPIYRELFGDIENQYPVAKWINNSGFYIGCHQYITKQEREYVVERIHAFFNAM